MQKIAILASGAGSNARRIMEHFQGSGTVRVDLVACNKAGAGVLDIAEEAGIDILMLERERFLNGDAYLPVFRDRDIRLIVLAGFLWKVPGPLVQAYPGRIVNIHPALLPRFGGKGMYGDRVHEAVCDRVVARPLGRVVGDDPRWLRLCARHGDATLDLPEAIERLHEEFKRRIKTQTVLPSADTAAILFWALLASGQINMRKVDGWQTLATRPIDQPIDVAA